MFATKKQAYIFCILFFAGFLFCANNAQASTHTIVYATQAGCYMDSNILTGGGHDDTACLQTILDSAPSSSSDSLELVLNGVALVHGLVVHSNTIISAPAGDGLYLASQSNVPVIKNYHREDGVNGLTGTDSNITLQGFTVNGNGSSQNKFEFSTWWVHAINLQNISNVKIYNITIRDSKNFGFMIANFNDFVADGLTGIYTNSTANNDFFHVWGPGSNIQVRNVTSNNGDDMIAFNIDETYPLSSSCPPSSGSYICSEGIVTNTLIENIIANNSANGIRLLNQHYLFDNILINNETGIHNNVDMNNLGGGPGNIGTVTVQNTLGSIGLSTIINKIYLFTITQGGLRGSGAIAALDGVLGSILNNVFTPSGNSDTPPVLTLSSAPATHTTASPSVTFSTTKAGTINYTGNCWSTSTASGTSVSSGSNTIVLDNTDIGENNCAITVTDAAGNQSIPLHVPTFYAHNACGGATACNCGDIVTSNYTLSADLNCGFYTSGIYVGANNLTINGAGHTITGYGSLSGYSGALSYLAVDNTDSYTGLATSNLPNNSSVSNGLNFEDPTPSLSVVSSSQNGTYHSVIFNSTVLGTLSFIGTCKSSSTSINAGSNTIIFNSNAGSYSGNPNCQVVVTNLAGTASSPLDISSIFHCGGATACLCGDTATSNYTLSADLICPSSMGGIFIGANNLTINGAGHVIKGYPSSGSYYAIDNTNGYTGLTLNNFPNNSSFANGLNFGSPLSLVSSSQNGTYHSVVINSTTAGTLRFIGTCRATSTSLSVGNNTITFNRNSFSGVSGCQIAVRDSGGITSSYIDISSVFQCGGATACLCGDAVTSDYSLSSDLSCPLLVNGLYAGANNVTIDGNGHSLSGNSSVNGITIGTYTGVAIKNFIITNFSSAIYLAGASNNIIQNNIFNTPLGNNVIDLESDSNNIGSTNNIITGNTITGDPNADSATGINVNIGSDSNIIIGNSIINAGGQGLYIDSNSNTITNNTIQGDSSADIVLDVDSADNVLAGEILTDGPPAADSSDPYYSDSGTNNSISSNVVAPAIPSNLAVVANSQTQITATWAANGNPSGTQYQIENATASNSLDWTTGTSGVFTGLTCGTSYDFKVKSRIGSTESSYTSVQSVSTQACSPVVVSVTGVSLNENTKTLTVGNTDQLTATIAPANASNQSVSWSSNNSAVATVSTSGLVTAVLAGTATITVTTVDGSFTATDLITVNAVTPSPSPSPVSSGGGGSGLAFLAILQNQNRAQNAPVLTDVFTLPLKYGTRGPQVILLQNLLKQLGFFSKSTKSNGIFGPATLVSVKAFQIKYKIAKPGVAGFGQVGPSTRAKLNLLNK